LQLIISLLFFFGFFHRVIDLVNSHLSLNSDVGFDKENPQRVLKIDQGFCFKIQGFFENSSECRMGLLPAAAASAAN